MTTINLIYLRLEFSPQFVPDVDALRSEGGELVLPESLPGRQEVLAGAEFNDLNVETGRPAGPGSEVLTQSTAGRLDLPSVAVVALSQRLLGLPHVLLLTSGAGD